MLNVRTTVKTKIGLEFRQPVLAVLAGFEISRSKVTVAFISWEIKNGVLLKRVCCAVTARLTSYTDVIHLHAAVPMVIKDVNVRKCAPHIIPVIHAVRCVVATSDTPFCRLVSYGLHPGFAYTIQIPIWFLALYW